MFHMWVCVKNLWKGFEFEVRTTIMKKILAIVLTHRRNLTTKIKSSCEEIKQIPPFLFIHIYTQVKQKKPTSWVHLRNKTIFFSSTRALNVVRGITYRLKNGVGGVAIVDKREFNERLPVMKRSSFDSAKTLTIENQKKNSSWCTSLLVGYLDGVYNNNFQERLRWN